MMAEAMATRNQARTRAPKACQRCGQRKIKCDGSAFGLPCSRCRSDGVSECNFGDSRRGSYPRKRRFTQLQNETFKEPQENDDQGTIAGAQVVSVSAAAQPFGYDDQVALDDRDGPDLPVTSTTESAYALPNLDAATSRHMLNYRSSQSFSTSSPKNPTTATLADQQVVSTTHPTGKDTAAPESLARMFGQFLRRRGNTTDDMADSNDIILFAESSPLTFALEEMQKDKVTGLHDVRLRLSDQLNNEEGLAGPQQNLHPAHMSSQDLTYLKNKGVFDFPQADILKALVEAFLTRFYPLYSIVDKDEFETLYRRQKIPWILLHAVCFIGVSFCDQRVIFQTSSKQRSHARQVFYDKAKLLFDMGYERNKIILLQSVLMLSFWGPKLDSYWNPSSWVGFAVTLAASLGIHRTASLARMDANGRSLLRRLWWTLVVRDASCATLLGRPFRIRMSHCDSDMLTLEDFRNELLTSPSGTRESAYEVQALYQIHVSKLSLILRQIIRIQSSENYDRGKTSELHTLLRNWEIELPQGLKWSRPSSATNVYVTSLKILFHHHLILIYLRAPRHSRIRTAPSNDPSTPPSSIAASAAQVISSSAITLMTTSKISSMPHETFAGFFIAGLVFYRQIQQQPILVAQLGRSALDNCQMVLYEARENCDAARWMMCIFDFLLSGKSELDSLELGHSLSSSFEATVTPEAPAGDGITTFENHSLHSSDLDVHVNDWTLPLQQDLMSLGDDFPFIPNLYPPMGDTTFDPELYC